MLQKLENAYLMILRVVVIAIAGLLLVAVGLFGLDSFKALQSEPQATTQAPQVSEQAIVKALTSKKAADATPAAADSAPREADPNQAYYQRAAAAIGDFVAKNSGGEDSVDQAKVIEIVKSRTLQQGDAESVAAFAKGLAEAIEKILADPAVVNLARSSSPLDVVNKALNLFSEEFSKQRKQMAVQDAARQQRYLEKKAEGMQSLYLAGAAFAAFLLIVFLSIFIRIERNLRHLEVKPVGGVA